jgi:formylglycine-generating enzyme required for sulfatase activity
MMKTRVLIAILAVLFTFIFHVAAAKDLPKIVVWDLAPREAKPGYAQELTSILVSEISKLGKYEIYSQENVRTLAGWTAEKMKLGCTSTQCLMALGQMDVAKLISGSVGKIGNRYSVSLSLFDTQNAKAEKAISEFCRTEDELIELVQKAGRQLLGVPVELAAAENRELDKTFTNSIGMEFVLIPAGKFVMGSPGSEAGRYENEGPQREVQISKPFYFGKYEVKVSEFREFVKAAQIKTDAETKGGAYVWVKDKWQRKEGVNWMNPGFSQKDDHPVICLAWSDAVEYGKWLSKKTGHAYRLPTEAEWEYACRAGTQQGYSFGPYARELSKYGWYVDNSGGKTRPVGQKKPNPWGLFDMHGNVREWCQDWYGNYAGGPAVDPAGPPRGSVRVLRGGNWISPAKDLRCAERRNGLGGSDRAGFRLVRMP